MRVRWIAVLPIAGLAAGLLGPATPAAARLSAAGQAPAVARTSAATPAQPPAVQTVTLITGDRVALTTSPDGRPQVTVIPATKGASFQVMTLRNQVYVVPQLTAGNLGTPLDPSLFDVSRLIASGYASTGKPLRLSVSYAPGAPHRAVPGFSPAGPGTVSVSSAGAAQFSHALAAQAVASGRPAAVPGGLFAGISRIALAGAGPARNSPPGRLYTLTIKGLDRRGRPVTGSFADVMSTDNVNNFLASQSYYRGVLKYMVPAGNYEIASFLSTRQAHGAVDYSLVTLPQVSVRRDTVVVVDARTASRFKVSAPDPTRPVGAQLALQRSDASGVPFTTTFVTFDATALYAAPTAPVTEGQLYFYPSERLGDASGGTSHYIYDVEFPYVGSIPKSLSETVTRSQLTAINAGYHAPYPGRSEYESRSARMPWQVSMAFGASALAAPLARTEYVLPVPGLLWYHSVMIDGKDSLGYAQDTVHAYQAGQHLSDSWVTQPEPPGLEQEPTVGQNCPACRSGNTFSLQLMPFTDAAGHFQLPDPSVTSQLSLYQNGTLTGQAPSTFAQFPMSPSPASYKLVLDQSRQAPWWPTTTSTHTTWAWNSRPRPPDHLPPGWTCGGKSSADRPAAAAGCSFEPLLFAGYQSGAGINDVVPAGTRATVSLSVGHQKGAAATAITGVTAKVSFNDGSTWTTVTPARTSPGHYQLAYQQPALSHTSGFASLRITATDAAGSSIDQTITRAYPLAVLPSPVGGTPPPPGQRPACGGVVPAPYVTCMAIVNTAIPGLLASGQPAGYGPADIQSAYALPGTAAGQTVAVVDAYNNPNAESDLAAYRAKYHLPPCTTANGCFRKVNQAGQASPLPAPDAGWGLEISLDLQAVSAACPRCHILLVEASSANITDLGPAVDTAVRLDANVVSNSYGSSGEFSGEQTFERYYHHPGVPIVVSTGDYGYGNGRLLINSISYPSASQYVVAAGGTSLTRAPGTARGWTESAWAGGTSGCSAYIGKPSWQKDQLCPHRMVADVSAVADPNTGLAVYDTFGYGGWLVVGGTSASAPVIASVYALAGERAEQPASSLYQNPGNLFDITTGANGNNCSATYLCVAGPGYDGPTGLGTPNGTGSF